MSKLPPPPENFICKLPELSGIQITGEQTLDYLQGQLTTNMQLLTEAQAQLACHCDFKGKMWNVGPLIKVDNRVLFLGNTSALAASLSELKKYGVFSKVDIASTDEDTTFFGLYGAEADNIVKALTGCTAFEHMQVSAFANGWVLSLKSEQFTRHLLCVEKADQHTDELLSRLPDAPSSWWQMMQILDGIPSIAAETSNEFVPQMLNLQALNAIDFNKGCYMGQEVVARTKYLGKNKRAMYILRGPLKPENDSQTITAGDTLEKAVEDNWRRGGTVIAATHTDEDVFVLAVLSNDSQIGEQLRLKATPEQTLSIMPLPYTINE